MYDISNITKKAHVKALFIHMNDKEHNINFTIKEDGEEGMLMMLDVTKISNNTRIKTDVYYKVTHTDHYLQSSPHHLAMSKLSMAASLFHMCEIMIMNEKRKKAESEKIKKVLPMCGSPRWALTV